VSEVLGPTKFRAYRKPEIGERAAAELVTVAPGSQGERKDLDETSGNGCLKSADGGNDWTRLPAPITGS